MPAGWSLSRKREPDWDAPRNTRALIQRERLFLKIFAVIRSGD
jgi:hypothetical protein